VGCLRQDPGGDPPHSRVRRWRSPDPRAQRRRDPPRQRGRDTSCRAVGRRIAHPCGVGRAGQRRRLGGHRPGTVQRLPPRGGRRRRRRSGFRSARRVIRGPVIPVIVIDEEAVAVPLARALVAGGLTVLEVTLRTKCALASIKRIVAEVPDAVVGAGTILTQADVAASVEAGAEFLVSPGSTPGVLDAMLDSGAAPLPGAATASEVMVFIERGLRHGKFFPAKPAGGIAYLKALAGPIPDFRFCPTGGIDLAGAPDFLALPNVACVGGSWITPKDAVAAGDWSQIETLAREAAQLGTTPELA